MNVIQHILKISVIVSLASNILSIHQCKRPNVYSDEKAYLECEKSVTDAGEKGFQFLTKQLKRNGGIFMAGERAAGVLGLLAGSQAYEDSKRFQRRIKGRGGNQLSNSIGLDFLIRIDELTKEYPETQNPLEKIDYTSLIQYMGITRVFCQNPKDYYGYDLYNEVVRRLKANDDEKLNGGLFLALCNTVDALPIEILDKQLKGTVQEPITSPFYVAEVSLKLLASICTEKKLSSQVKDVENNIAFEGYNKQLSTIKKDLSGKLEKYFEIHGTFGKFLDVALATQPLNSLHEYSKLYLRSIPDLLEMQKSDGSFGSSVPFTSVALSSITHITSSDLNTISCGVRDDAKDQNGNPIVRLSYVIEDKVITGQRTTSNFNVPKGSKLISALQENSKLNPYTFKLIVNEIGAFTKIVSWNEIENKDNLQAYWRVQKDTGNGLLLDITDKLGHEALFQDTRYIITFITK